MKKTFQVNINGSVFYIDDDAYELLDKYLNQLRQAFPTDEGKEIVDDIEARIAEHFTEITHAGASVITIDNVNRVIEKMGRPSDFSESPAADRKESAAMPTPPPIEVKKRLYRNMQNKVFGGVLGGVACYFGWNANLLRLLVAVLAISTYLGPMLLAYLVAWMVIPAAVTPRQVLEMMGEPVTIGSVGQTIIGSSAPNSSNDSAGLLGALGKIILAFLGLFAGIIALGMLVMFLKIVCGLIVFGGWGSLTLLDDFNFGTSPVVGAIGAICLALCIALPCVALVWATCAVVFKVRGISKNVLIGGAILELILIIAAVVLLSVASLPISHIHSLASAATMATVSSTIC